MKREVLIQTTLDTMFPDAHVELNHQSTFQLLVAVVLSAQTTDKSVNKVTENLFKTYPDAMHMSLALPSDIEPYIKSIGLYKNKAKHLTALSKDIMERFQGEVPSLREHLESLPGVGRKTANVILSNAFNEPALAVDTHVNRVSKRLKLAKESDSVLQVEYALMKKFPKSSWTKLHHQLIFFGRYHCLAQNPKCQKCPLFEICGYEQKINAKK